MAVVGRIARAHGIRGQVIVNLDTDFPEERFRPGAELFVNRLAKTGQLERLTVTTLRFHRGRPVIGLALLFGVPILFMHSFFGALQLAGVRPRLGWFALFVGLHCGITCAILGTLQTWISLYG